MKESKLKPLLNIFASESIISDILNNQREITLEEYKKLKDYAFKFFCADN